MDPSSGSSWTARAWCVDTMACPRARDVAATASSQMIDTMPTARRGSTLAILIGMGTPTHMLPEGMPAHWELADLVPRGVKDLRTLPEDTVAYTIGPSPPELPGSSHTPQLQAALSSQSVREALQHVASDDAPTAFGCGLGLSGDRLPRPCAGIDNAACPGVRPPRRGSTGDSRRAACRPFSTVGRRKDRQISVPLFTQC